MTNLEAYIFNRYGQWIPFDVCSQELGFDIEEALSLMKGKRYHGDIINGKKLHYRELAHLVELNMHLEE